jgi:hypothetical protein
MQGMVKRMANMDPANHLHWSSRYGSRMMKPFTPWGGVDSPSKGEVSPCLGFWFLNPSACQVCLHCIVYHVTFVWWTIYFIPHIFSCCLENFFQVLFGDDKKITSGCYFSVLVKKKKNGGEDVEILYFLLIAFQILHVFLPDMSIHCALIEYAYIWLKVYD